METKKLKFGISQYFKPTPKNIRIFGDLLLTTSTFLGGYSMIMESKTMSIVIIAMGLIGKIITNMFTES